MAESWDASPTFAVVFEGRVAGTVNFEIDRANSIAMLGYGLGRPNWGKGIALEAVRAAVAWAFDAFDLAKIWATTDARNVRSRRLLEKLGMTLEGRLRSHERARDGRADKLYYGVLRTDWVDRPSLHR
jgi:[ribosomal protein S5]-alanine N-acetyltransferase